MEDALALMLSASQIQLWIDCKRKWGLRYLAGLDSPPHPSAVLGSEVHDEQFAPYYTQNRPFDFTRDSGYIAASAMVHLPRTDTPGLVSEQSFVMPSPSLEFSYRGYIDLWMPNGGMPHIDDYTRVDDTTTVVDFKTTGNMQWAKTPEILSTDIQAQIYATYAMFSTGQRTVNLDWLYVQTKGTRKSKRVHLQVTGDHVAEQLAAIDSIGRDIAKAYRDGVDPYDLPVTASMCEQYGGCPYRSHCNLSPDQIIESLDAKSRLPKELMMDNVESLLANLKAKRTNGAAPPADTGPVNPPETSLPQAPPVGVASTDAPKAKRTRKAKASTPEEVVEAPGFDEPATTPAKPFDVTDVLSTACNRAAELVAIETDLDKVTRLIATFAVQGARA